jgi:hypothetical protein
VPTSVTDGMVKPAGVSDEDWTVVIARYYENARLQG